MRLYGALYEYDLTLAVYLSVQSVVYAQVLYLGIFIPLLSSINNVFYRFFCV